MYAGKKGNDGYLCMNAQISVEDGPDWYLPRAANSAMSVMSLKPYFAAEQGKCCL